MFKQIYNEIVSSAEKNSPQNKDGLGLFYWIAIQTEGTIILFIKEKERLFLPIPI